MYLLEYARKLISIIKTPSQDPVRFFMIGNVAKRADKIYCYLNRNDYLKNISSLFSPLLFSTFPELIKGKKLVSTQLKNLYQLFANILFPLTRLGDVPRGEKNETVAVFLSMFVNKTPVANE